MRTRWLVSLTSSVLVLAACTGHPADRAAPPPEALPELRDVVVLETVHGTDVVDTSSGAVLAADAGEVAAPDGSRLYATRRAGDATILRTRDSVTGEVVARTSLDGGLEVRVASVSGHAVALMRPLARSEGTSTELAMPRARTTIVVADPAGGEAPRRYVLDGNYEPEAFSIDDRRLFLIQYLPAEAPTAYRVTFLDLRRSKVFEVFGRFRTPPERMPGVRLEQVYDNASQQLYTLYTNHVGETYGGTWDGYGSSTADADEVSFVHVLNLRDGWAYCAGLPRALWGRPEGEQALATAPDGRSLYIVDPMRSLIVEMNTRTLKVVRRASVDLGTLGDGTVSAQIGSDGRTLFVGANRRGAPIVAIDLRTLRVAARWTMPSGVAGFGISEDGGRLYAALVDQVRVVDSVSGRELAELRVPGVDSILHVATPAA
ncbi:MAG TPA: hypothetical protein VFA25_09200 [Actinomycetota bacterium]|nr:hypothetical protein [Actinomycetota bacterium]